MPVTNPSGLVNALVKAIIDFQKECKQERAQLDVSGGIDSAVMLCLLAKALPKENITAVYSDIYSSPESRKQAQEVAAVAGVKLHIHVACDMYDDLVETIIHDLGEDAKRRLEEDLTIGGSIRSTLRAPIGRAYNRLAGGGIRYGTGNECEDRFLRFYQKGGDGEVDCNPLASLSKGEIFQLAAELGVPASIQKAIPSPDLWSSGAQHNDEDELLELTGVKWTYARVDGDSYTPGTIEIMARFLDRHNDFLFKDFDSNDLFYMAELYKDDEVLKLLPKNEIFNYMKSAKNMERITRHKANPNCSTLVTRKDLLENKLITNSLS